VIFFTADLHLGHANIIKHCDRPFSSVEEMDEHLIFAWNKSVRPNDSVYILGDLIFRSSASPDSYLSRLRGKKHLIFGNHDKDWVKKSNMSEHFISVERFAEISDGKHKITLCHYPLMSWNHMAKGSYMIHGHIHNNREAFYFPMLRQMPNLLNAGVEINDYRPVSFDVLVANNERFKSERTEKEVVDDMMSGFDALGVHMQGLASQAIQQYTHIAEDIISGRIEGENKIGWQLDFMLDFCWDDAVYELYRKVLDSLQDKYPELVESYHESYRDMWDSNDIEEDEELDL
jgi:calcineurin-like phosphoesterase family protein